MSGADSDPDGIELPVWLGGCQKWVTGLTKRTTCDDVIYALMVHEANPNDCIDVSNYAMYERWRGVERPLRGRTKMLKVWRAWGVERNTVKFSVHKVHTNLDESRETLKTKRHKRQHTSRDKDRRSRDRQRARSEDARRSSSVTRVTHGVTGFEDTHKSREFHDLVQVVIDQEKKIQDQLSRLTDTDGQIDNYETKMHLLRIKENGQNYVQEAYLRDKSEDSSSGGEELFPAIKANDLEAYMHICDNILEMEHKITAEGHKITTLSQQIRERSHPSDTNVGSNPNLINKQLMDEVALLRQEMERCISLSSAQDKQMQLVQQTIEDCEIEMQRKATYIQSLESEFTSEFDQDHYYSTSVTNTPPLPPRLPVRSVHFDPNDTLILDGRLHQNQSVSSPDSGIDHDDDQPSPRFPIHNEMAIDVSGLSQYSTHDNVNHIPTAQRKRDDMEFYVTKVNSYTDFSSHEKRSGSDADTNSDTGLSSLHSDDASPILETLV